ncbi:hypothetical protein H5410_063521 [Solanum commersonii]|uniref:Uncharacterized protein n=1 Tax=Solanum commersonii TaxID=4109 RepID=A0A9J5WDG8_SOLCO|nr:hypothetical protein H5410_063521 [Solanum commersonii]
MSKKDAEKRASVVHFAGRGPRETLPFKRADGWMELKMGDFFNDAGEDGYVDARLMETKKLDEKRPHCSRSGVSSRMKKRTILLLLCPFVLVSLF